MPASVPDSVDQPSHLGASGTALWRLHERGWPDRLRRVVWVALFNALIALIVSLVARHAFWGTLVYSQCIGFSIWGFMELLVWRLDPPGHMAPRLKLALPAFSILLGYAAGSALGSMLTGIPYWRDAFSAPREMLGELTLTLLAGTSITAFFVFREQIARTRSEAEAARRLAAETQLRLLQAQLEPHMLFNTLANLRALIALDPPRAQLMLDHMIAFVRATLNASRSGDHTLAEEFARLADYLALMQIRMGARLRIDLRLPPALRDARLPAMLLQPLVENAIKHGLEPQVEGGELVVEARQAAGRIVITVADGGVGWSAVPPSAQSFGLQQVRERLKAAFGEQAQMNTQSPAEGGARVELSWPHDAQPACFPGVTR